MIHKKWVIDACTTKITTTGKSLSEALLFAEHAGESKETKEAYFQTKAWNLY